MALFHGYTESKEQHLPVARSLRDRGFGVVLVDIRWSSRPSTCAHPELVAHGELQVKAVLDLAERATRAQPGISR